MSRTVTSIVIRAALVVATSSLVLHAAQAPTEGSRRLARVPAPIGASGATQELYTGSYALVVGVSKYDHPEAWATLDTVPREMDDLAAALQQSGFDRVERVTNPTGQELRTAVEGFIRTYGYNRGNRLLLFFSGHGHTLDRGERGYFVPRDAPDPDTNENGFRGTAISMQQVATWAQDLTAKHALFAFDSCFSGTIFRTREKNVPARISELTAKPVRQFLSAGGAGEPVPARSVFTPSFIRALHGEADLDKDGFVTGTELGNYVQRQVIEYKTRQTPQFGKIRDPQLDEGEFVFAVPRGAIVKPPDPVPPPVVVTLKPEQLAGASLDALTSNCERGQAAACNESGRRYENGNGVPRDHGRAVTFYERACTSNLAAGCTNLGSMYRSGLGVTADLARAVTLFQRGCDGGDAKGCTSLGVLRAFVPETRNEAAAASLYQRGCDGGDAEGCTGLAGMYRVGVAVPRDLPRAVALYQRGCAGGDMFGCFRLADMLEQGRGVAQDRARALDLYRRACANIAEACEAATRLGGR